MRRAVYADRNRARGLNSAGKQRKHGRRGRVPNLERKWDQLAVVNARQAFRYWFTVRATDAQIAAWFAALGTPWRNPRLTDTESYAMQYRLDPVFAEKERNRQSERRFLNPDVAAQWAKDGTRWYQAVASSDGTVDWLAFLSGVDQIIVGGESNQGGHKARPFDIEWARSTVRQCKAAGVACFFKQAGSNPQEVAFPAGVTKDEEARWHADGWTRIEDHSNGGAAHWRRYFRFKDRAGADPSEWPHELRVQEPPRG